MTHYILIQPPQNPPGDPNRPLPDPRGNNPVPIAGGWILIIAGALYGIYYFYKLHKLLRKK